jgi:hypothetical protein
MLGRLGMVKEGTLSGQENTPRQESGVGRTAQQTAWPLVGVETMRNEPSTQSEKRSPTEGRASVVAKKPGNAGGAKGRRKVEVV